MSSAKQLRLVLVTPETTLLDEPVSALDVSVQSQILNLLVELQNELGLSYLFIAHDLSVVRHICDRVAVMYLGKIAEIADRNQLFNDPKHPYTEALMAAVPVPDPDVEADRPQQLIVGEVPSPQNPPSGCQFHPRCPKRLDECSSVQPTLDYEDARAVACHLHAQT